VKDRQSGALVSRCKAKSFGRKLDAQYLAGWARNRKAIIGAVYDSAAKVLTAVIFQIGSI
jgi:hypothetical protein